MVALGVVYVPGLLKATQGGSPQDVLPGKTDAMAGGNGATAAQGISQSEAASRLQPRVVAVVPLSDPPAAVANNQVPAAPAPLAAPNPVPNPVPNPAPSVAQAPAPAVVANAAPTGGGASAVVAPLAAAINTPAAASPPPPAMQLPPPAAIQPAPPPVAAVPAPRPQPAPAPAAESSTPSLDSSEIASLMKRGQYFLDSGDISSAQLLFRRAAEGGSAQGAFALASTYDLHYLAAHQVIGVAGNDAKARIWYQRALDLGSPDAKGMLAQLGGR